MTTCREKRLKDGKKIIVQQYAHENIPNSTRVKVLKKDGALKIIKEVWSSFKAL